MLLASVSSFAATIPCAPVADITFYSGSTDCTAGLFDQLNVNLTYSSNFNSVLVSLLGVDITAGGDDIVDDIGFITDPPVVTDHANYWIDLKGEVIKAGMPIDILYLDNKSSGDTVIFETLCKVPFAVDFGQCAPENTLASFAVSSGQEAMIRLSEPVNTLYWDKHAVLGDAWILEVDNGWGVASPEPVTFILIGSALIAIACIRTKRRA